MYQQPSNGSWRGGYYCEFRTDDNQILNVDYAKVAEGYGAKSYRANTVEELKAALEDAKKQDVSTLIEMKVLPKTMTDGYDSWWHVGVAEVSEQESVQKAYEAKEKCWNLRSSIRGRLIDGQRKILWGIALLGGGMMTFLKSERETHFSIC